MNVRAALGTLTAAPLLLLLALAGPSPALAQSTTQTDPGEQVYQANCAACHGAQGQGGDEAASLHALLASKATVPGVVRLVQRGRYGMPGFSQQLSPAQIQAVAAYVVGRFASQGDVPKGGELYRLNCAGCHGAAIGGGALIYTPKNAPSLMDVNSADVAAAVRTGPGLMPAFNQASIPDDQLAAISAYITALQSPATPGGLTFPYPGPVTEGLIAFVIGIGAAVLAAVWVERGGRG